MSKKDELKKWKNRISWAINDSEARREREKRAVELYEAQKDDRVREDGTTMPTVPIIYSIFATMLPALFSSMPKVKASPRTPEDINKSELVESILKDIFERTNIYQEIQHVVLSAIIKGTGFIKMGFKAETEETPKAEDEIFKLFEKQFPEGLDEDFEKFKEEKVNLIDEIITNEGVWVKYVTNNKIYLDPEAKDLESCNFVIHKLLYTKEEFKRQFGNVQLDKTHIEKVSIEDDEKKTSKHKNSSFLKSEDSNRFKLYEIWSKQDRKRMVIAEGHDKFLESSDWPHQLADYPFEVLAPAPKPDSVYGMEVLLMLEDAARINNEMVDKQEDNAQRATSGTFMEPKAMSEDQQERYENPGAKKLVEVDDINRIKDFITPPVPQETYQVSGEMRRIMEETAHVSAQTRQTSEKGKQTATEIDATVQAGDVLTFFKIREIERFIERITKKVMALVKEWYTQPQLVKIEGSFGQPPVWQEWTGGDIGEFVFTVKAGSAAHQDTAVKLQQKMQYLGQVVNLIQFFPNPQPLIQTLLTEIGDLQDINSEAIAQAFQAPQQQVSQASGLPAALVGAGGAGNPSVPNVPTPEQTAPAVNAPRIPAPTI